MDKVIGFVNIQNTNHQGSHGARSAQRFDLQNTSHLKDTVPAVHNKANCEVNSNSEIRSFVRVTDHRQ